MMMMVCGIECRGGVVPHYVIAYGVLRADFEDWM